MERITKSRRVVAMLAILVVTMLLPAATALGANGGTVGLYVEYGDGRIDTYCLQTTTPIRYVEALVAAEDMGGFKIEWADYGAMGIALCGVDRPPLGTLDQDIEGCESADCFCNPEAFWNYHYLPAGGEWSWNHFEDMNLYDGDVGAYVFGAYGTQPATLMTFDEICAEEEFVPEAGTLLLLGSGIPGLAAYAALRLRGSRKQAG